MAATARSLLLPPYSRLAATLRTVRRRLQRPLTLAEKILYAHLRAPSTQEIVRGESYLKLAPDRVAMQDASAQMAILQFMLSGMQRTAVPSTIHCDHLIEAHRGAAADLEAGKVANKEIFDFLESAAASFGMGFWKPGSGIIHQIVLENYAAPGGLMLGTGTLAGAQTQFMAGPLLTVPCGLGMLAIGVGGADAVDAMADLPWELKAPRITGVHLKGRLGAWTAPKDIILKLAGQLTVQGGTGHIVEYFGDGAASLSATGMATICNMGAELGATTSVFPFSDRMAAYLRATERADVADAAEALRTEYLTADAGAQYDRVVELDLSTLEPHIRGVCSSVPSDASALAVHADGPFTPDLAHPLSQFTRAVRQNRWPETWKVALIGSCTNSSYEDMTKAAAIARQAAARGLPLRAQLLVTPGSEQIRATIARDGQSAALEAVGAEVLANACGPCIGQWKRTDVGTDEENAILTSFNRNFRGRNDGNSKTMHFIASPEIVMAMAFAGKTTFNPMTDSIPLADGSPFQFTSPTADDLPAGGFDKGTDTFVPPLAEGTAAPAVSVAPSSDRLQVLAPFPAWNGRDWQDLLVLIKVQGKCTTDHISAAGPWLKYKGHLDNIAENTLIGATNAESGKVNEVVDRLSGKAGTVPAVARAYKAARRPWIVIADENYGEGSAREHAAMQPRYLGGVAIVARSFARIHETNLKKQGMLPLTFANKKDYDRISSDCRVATVGLEALTPTSEVRLRVTPPSGPAFEIPVRHTLSEDQIAWFRAGSALNFIAQQHQAAAR